MNKPIEYIASEISSGISEEIKWCEEFGIKVIQRC